MKTLLLILLLLPCALIAQEEADSTEVEIVIAPSADEEKEEPIFMIVEKMPEFPGGHLALRKYISVNIRYPQEAVEQGIVGKVYVRYCINSEGDVENVSIARGIDPLLDKEALRVIKSLPKWKPGEQRGKKVSVWYTSPVYFGLE